MLETVQCTTLLCLFHDDASAFAAVHDLLALGVDECDLAVVGDAPTELPRNLPTDTLSDILTSSDELSRVMHQAHDEGTIVAVHTTEPLTRQVDEIFRRNSVEETSPSQFHRDDRLNFEEENRLDMIESEEIH